MAWQFVCMKNTAANTLYRNGGRLNHLSIAPALVLSDLL